MEDPIPPFRGKLVFFVKKIKKNGCAHPAFFHEDLPCYFQIPTEYTHFITRSFLPINQYMQSFQSIL